MMASNVSLSTASDNVQNEIRIVAIGHTGDGKSSACNSILQKKNAFVASLKASSVTKTCSHSKEFVLGKSVLVVDTPGFFDTRSKSIEDTATEVAKCVLYCAPGPHAFIYVVPIGSRFSKEYIDTLVTVKNLFGEHCTDYMIVLFTHADSFEADGQSIAAQLDDYIHEGPDVVKELVEKCGNRYVAFNNKLEKNSEENAVQVNALLRMVDLVVVSNKDKGPFYSTKLLEKAEKEMKKNDDDKLAILQKQKDEEVKHIEAKCHEKVSQEYDLKMQNVRDEYELKMKNVCDESRSEVEKGESFFGSFINGVLELLTFHEHNHKGSESEYSGPEYYEHFF